MKKISAVPMLLYFVGTTMAALRHKRLARIPVFTERYRQLFFGHPLHVCFGCSPHNALGLKLDFFRTDMGGLAFKWEPVEGMESFPNIVHGGISGALLDEVGGVLIQADLQLFALTVSSRIHYHYPVYRSRLVWGHARIVARYKKYVLVQGELFDEKGKILSSMTALYFVPGKSMFKHLTKLNDIPEELAGYVAE